jgi:hypothetical protein
MRQPKEGIYITKSEREYQLKETNFYPLKKAITRKTKKRVKGKPGKAFAVNSLVDAIDQLAKVSEGLNMMPYKLSCGSIWNKARAAEDMRFSVLIEWPLGKL